MEANQDYETVAGGIGSNREMIRHSNVYLGSTEVNAVITGPVF